MNINKNLKRCSQHNNCVYRQPISSPGSLQGICYAKIKVALFSASERRLREVFNLEGSKKSMKEYMSQLPITCREQLLVNIMTADEGNDHFKLGISEILFAEGVTKLELFLGMASNPTYCEALLQLVSTEGQKLSTLKLRGIYFFHMNESHYEHFKNIFTSAQNLSTLHLLHICDDEMLKLIGENCSSLRDLDVSSPRITNKGFHLLTQNIVRLPSGTVNSVKTLESTVWGLPDVFLDLEKLVPPGEEASNYERRKSPLCGTLRSLNIGRKIDLGFLDDEFPLGEKVSSKTIMALLEMLPNLQSLGDTSIDELCEDDDLLMAMTMENVFQLPSLSLKSAVLRSTNGDKVSIVSRLFPNLVRLNCKYDSAALMFQLNIPSSTWSLDMFNAFNHLECLKVSCLTGVLTKRDLRELSSDLRQNLRELNIHANPSVDPFKLSGIVTFPRLTRLQLVSPNFVWGESENFSSLEDLHEADLVGGVTTEVVIKILQCAPNLKNLRFLDIVDRGTDFLQRIMGAIESSKLESFELLRGFLIDTEEELKSFLAHFEKMQHVGKIRFLEQW